MAKWEFKEEREGDIIRIMLLRDSIGVGVVAGRVKKLTGGVKCFVEPNIVVQKQYRQEYKKAHNGTRMGEALGLELIKSLKREGISHIRHFPMSELGRGLIERAISRGIVEETPDELLKIIGEQIPATSKARATELAIRAASLAKERVAKMEKFRKRVEKFRRIRPK